MKYFTLLALLVAGHSILAADDDLGPRVQKLEILMDELRTRENAPATVAAPNKEPKLEILHDTDQLRSQLGPVASKIYFDRQTPWTVGLSAEVFTFQKLETERLNVLSVSPALAFRPHRRVIFNSQFLFENGGSESRNTITYQKGQSVVHLAYVDWLYDDEGSAGLRVGHQLIPVGLSNTQNESVTYRSVLKPELERELIPGSWHENGVSLWVDRPRADLQIGIFNSLDARGFRGETFLAGGRAQGQNAAASDLMGVFRVNAKTEFILLGASIAAGNTAQNDPALRNGGFRLAEIHGKLRLRRFEAQAMGVLAQVDDADAISVYNGTTMASQARGNSVEVAFDALASAKHLWIFARHSAYNLNARVPGAYLPNSSLDKTATVFGLSYSPLANLVIKGDYALKENAGSSKTTGELSLGLGVVF